jgi:hypothetical protein
VNIELPNGDRMFEGPGSDAANNNCLACHSAGMVLNQPALSKAQWRTEVEKMRTAYRAPIDPKDVDGIIDYLAGMKIARWLCLHAVAAVSASSIRQFSSERL